MQRAKNFFKKLFTIKEPEPERYRLEWDNTDGRKLVKVPICEETEHDWDDNLNSPPWERTWICNKCGLQEDGYGKQW